MTRNPNEFTFLEHIDELRSRILKSLLVFVVLACILYNYVDPILSFAIKPIGKVIYTSPTDAFMAKINLTLLGSLFLSLPFLLYQIWQFVAVGLKGKERKAVAVFGPLSLLFFMVGILFGYFIAVPISLKFLLSFSTDQMVAMITVNNYISFIGSMVLAFGIIFELPLVLMFLTKIGIATPAFLIHYRRHAIVAIMIISAIFTPPDVITQFIMAIPLLVLYELGILFSKWSYRR